MKKRGKRGKKIKLVVGLLVVIVVAALIVLYLTFWKSSGGERVVLKNPATDLSDKEAIARFDESFVFYLLVSIEAQELHNVPLTSDEPKMEMHLEDVVYSAVISDGKIGIGKGVIPDEDVIIRTTKSEAVKMIRDQNYIEDSFRSGGSGIELVASKATLLGKGYLGLYTDLTGESITGDVLDRLFD